jgi:hypothetical protein
MSETKSRSDPGSRGANWGFRHSSYSRPGVFRNDDGLTVYEIVVDVVEGEKRRLTREREKFWRLVGR